MVAHTERIAACAVCPRFEVLSGARKSSAWAAAMASIAIALRVFSTMRLQLQRRRHSHGDIIFFVAGSGDRIHRRGMRQHFVLADQRGGGHLRHHESGVQACAGSQEWRQAFIQRRVHQALQPALGDAGQRAERDAQKIQSEGQGLAWKLPPEMTSALGRPSSRSYVDLQKHQRVVHRRVDFDLQHLAAVGQRVAHRAMHLRHAAQGVGILHAVAVAMRFAHRAAFEHLAQIRGRLHLAACGRA